MLVSWTHHASTAEKILHDKVCATCARIILMFRAKPWEVSSESLRFVIDSLNLGETLKHDQISEKDVLEGTRILIAFGREIIKRHGYVKR